MLFLPSVRKCVGRIMLHKINDDDHENASIQWKEDQILTSLLSFASNTLFFQFVCLEGLVTSMSDLYPSYFFTGHRRKMLLLAICLLCFVVGLFLVTEVRVVTYKD